MIKHGSLIGEGGEARVYKYKDKAVKIFRKDVSDKLSIALCGLDLERIVTPIELLYEDGKFIGYIMDYIKSVDNVKHISKSEFLESMLLIKKDLSVLAKNEILAGDLIPRNSVYGSEGLYFIDTSSYSMGNSDYLTSLRINNQMLELYMKSLLGYSSGSIDGRKYLSSTIKDCYSTINSEMLDNENMEDFAKRLVKKKSN